MRLRGDKNSEIYADRIIGYRCNWIGCHYISNTRELLISHINFVHLRQRPFSCNKCDLKFTADYYLRKHKRTVHSIDSKLLKCDRNHCQFKTKSENGLKIHNLKHKRSKRITADSEGSDNWCQTIVSDGKIESNNKEYSSKSLTDLNLKQLSLLLKQNNYITEVDERNELISGKVLIRNSLLSIMCLKKRF